MIKDDKKFKYDPADKMWLPRYVCEAVSRRASMMASAGVTALLKKMDYKVRIGGFSLIKQNICSGRGDRHRWVSFPIPPSFQECDAVKNLSNDGDQLQIWSSPFGGELMLSSYQRFAKRSTCLPFIICVSGRIRTRSSPGGGGLERQKRRLTLIGQPG